MFYFGMGLICISALAILLAGYNRIRHLIASYGQQTEPVLSADVAENPDVVITLVHGTWATEAAWTNPDSKLCKSLLEIMGQQIHFHRFPWSGGNSIWARRISGKLLRQKCNELVARYPNAKHFLIGHSHGGNIILDCLTSPLAREISGVICLATPVLTAERRKLDPVATLALMFMPAVLAIPAAKWFADFVKVKDGSWIELLALGAGILVGWRVVTWAKEIRIDSEIPFMRPDKIVFVRVVGDEASAAISIANFLAE